MRKFLIINIFLMGLCGPVLYAQYHGEQGRESLRGLKGVAVEVSEIDSVVELDGLKKFQLENDVVLRLQQAGIKALTDRAWSETPGQPLLFISVRTIKYEELGVYFYSIEVDLNQEVTITRKPSIRVGGRTWGTSVVGFIGESEIREELRESVIYLIDIFIDDYFTVNSK